MCASAGARVHVISSCVCAGVAVSERGAEGEGGEGEGGRESGRQRGREGGGEGRMEGWMEGG